MVRYIVKLAITVLIVNLSQPIVPTRPFRKNSKEIITGFGTVRSAMLTEYGAEEQCTSKTDFINSLALMLGTLY